METRSRKRANASSAAPSSSSSATVTGPTTRSSKRARFTASSSSSSNPPPHPISISTRSRAARTLQEPVTVAASAPSSLPMDYPTNESFGSHGRGRRSKNSDRDGSDKDDFGCY